MNIKLKNVVSLGMSLLISFSSGNVYSQNHMIYADSNYIDGINTMNAITFTIEGGTANTDYTYENGVLTIKSSTPMTIKNSDPNTPTSDRIEINSEANLTLAGVNIEATDGAAIKIADDATFNVNIFLEDGSKNILKGKEGSWDNPGFPGIEKNGESDNIGLLTISISDGSVGTGKLTATGGYYGAGIGGGKNGSASNITISGGEITATGGNSAAGIGGGSSGNGSNITISGGEVTATGGYTGAGIGGGNGGDASNITINGGSVIAISNGADYAGAGIGGGGGYGNNGSNITISGGLVKAIGYGGAGIGGGNGGDGNNIKISGGIVIAIGKDSQVGYGGGAGIGGGQDYNGTGDGSDNILEGNAVLIAACENPDKNVLQGFTFKSGIVFESQGDSGTYEGTMYGDKVTITGDVTFPSNFTIEENKTLEIYKDVTLTIDKDTELTINDGAVLKNRGILVENGNIKFDGNGVIETEIIYVAKKEATYNESNSDNIPSTSEYKTYLDSNGIKTYGELPMPTRNGYDFEGWYTEKTGGEQIKEDTQVMPNLHVLYAHWKSNEEQTPEPTPSPTPEEKPEPTPEANGGNSEGFSWNYIERDNVEEIQIPEEKPNEAIKTKTLKDIQKEIPERLKNIAYIKGYKDGTFKPNNNITRAEAATMLYKLMYDGRQIDINILYQYNDVEKNNWSTAAIAYLSQQGITQGFDGKFRPNDKITRAEFAKIVYESLLSYNMNKNSKLIYGENEFRFSDIKNDWTFEPIKQLATNEMINGYENNLFKPNENITRAEAVKIINKAFGRSENWIGSVSFDDVSENHWAYKFIMNAANGIK